MRRILCATGVLACLGCTGAGTFAVDAIPFPVGAAAATTGSTADTGLTGDTGSTGDTGEGVFDTGGLPAEPRPEPEDPGAA